jgi:hypothetical protein
MEKPMPKTNQSTIEPLEDFGCHNQSPYRRLRKRDRSGENVQGLASANQVFCRSLLSIHSSATTFSRRYTRRDTKKNEARVIQDISRHIVPRVLLHSVTPGCFGGPDSSQVKSPNQTTGRFKVSNSKVQLGSTLGQSRNMWPGVTRA